MSSRLDRISETDLEANARQACYQPAAFAGLCNVCLRQVQRQFTDERRITPREWLDQLRLHDAQQILARGELVKIVALRVGFSKTSHFSRWYRRLTGVNPSESILYNGGIEKNVVLG
jgi:AraC-like DNA-binding protein